MNVSFYIGKGFVRPEGKDKKETLDVERIRLHSGRDGRDEVDRIATDEDKKRYPEEYAAFKAELEKKAPAEDEKKPES